MDIPDRSPLLAALNEVDPLRKRLEKTDRLVSDFMLSSNQHRSLQEEFRRNV